MSIFKVNHNDKEVGSYRDEGEGDGRRAAINHARRLGEGAAVTLADGTVLFQMDGDGAPADTSGKDEGPQGEDEDHSGRVRVVMDGKTIGSFEDDKEGRNTAIEFAKAAGAGARVAVPDGAVIFKA